MEALPTLTIGNNVQHVRAQGAQEQLVAAIATGQAGCTPTIGEGASPCLGH